MSTMPITRTPQTLDKNLNKETMNYEPINTVTETSTSTATLTMAGTSTQSTVQTNLTDVFQAKEKTEDIDKEEYKVIEFVEFVIKNIGEEVNTDSWLDEAVTMMKFLRDHFKTQYLEPCFNHLDKDKFSMRRGRWEKELSQTKSVQTKTVFLSKFKTITVQDYTQTEGISGYTIPVWCYKMIIKLHQSLESLKMAERKMAERLKATKEPLSTLPPLDATQNKPIVKESSNLITLNDSQSTLASEIVGNKFQDRAKQHPTYQHYLT